MIWLVILVGTLIGYWVVSALLERGESPTVLGTGPEQSDQRWYMVLGVRENASLDEVMAAYRSAMSQYHPDKVAHLGEELRMLAEKKSKQINAAYEEALKSMR